MKHAWTVTILAALMAVGLLAGLAAGPLDAQTRNTLVAKKAAAPPALDGTLDAAWNGVAPLTVKAMGGKNLPGGSTEISLRALYPADSVYFLMQYKDATESLKRGPWVKQPDGSWKQLKDPADKGGDNNTYYEDKAALIWAINAPSFEAKGCMAACHTGEGKPYGNKYLPAGERADMWHWKGVRTGSVGQIDDQYLDDTKYDPVKAKEAGRKSDPKTGGGYADNVNDAKNGPKFALRGNTPAPPYWILDADKEPFDDAKYKAGDEVPGIVVAPFTGDRGDISMKAVYKDGGYTLVFWRKLNTNSEYDVQFTDLKKQYTFGVAVFDNAQVRHAFVPTPLKLTFE